MKTKPKKKVTKKVSKPMKPETVVASVVPSRTLVLRTCNADMTSSHDGKFVWPRSGHVEAPDWDPKPECGHGLHGLAWGQGDWSLLSSATDAVWLVVEVETSSIVHIDKSKVKFPKGNVVFAGSRVEATIRVLCGTEAMSQACREAQDWQKENPSWVAVRAAIKELDAIDARQDSPKFDSKAALAELVAKSRSKIDAKIRMETT
jgi:hypothetical protein